MFKNSVVFSILIVSLNLSANLAPPSIEYVKFEGDINGFPENSENLNTIYRDANLDEELGISREDTLYRITLENDEMTDIVKFSLNEGNSLLLYNDYFVFYDRCAVPGKYLYVSNLDCSESVNDFHAVKCRNYAEIEFIETAEDFLCDSQIYEDVELDEGQIEELKSEMYGDWADIEIEEEAMAFNAEVGQQDDRLVILKNESDKFKSSLILYEDRFPDEPFHVILSDAEGSCKHGLILAPQESCTLYIRFAPETAGIYEDEFWIESYYYYDYVDLTGRCTGEVSDDSDNEVDEDNLSSDDDSHENADQIPSENPDDQKSDKLETDDDAVIGENSSDGCSVTVL